MLSLLAMLAFGAASALLGLDACRLGNAFLPGVHPASAWAFPASCIAFGAGAAFTAWRHAGRRADHISRWFAAAAAGALAGPALWHAWTTPVPPLSVFGRAAVASAAFAPAWFCLGAALPLLAAMQTQNRKGGWHDTAVMICWIALGSAVAAWRWLPMLLAGLRPADFAAAMLVGASLVSSVLTGLSRSGAVVGVSPTNASPVPPATRSSARAAPETLTLTARRRRASWLGLGVTGVACGFALPALLRVVAAHDGDGLAMSSQVVLLLSLAGLVISFDGKGVLTGRWSDDAVLWLLFAWAAPASATAASDTPGRLLEALPVALVAGALVRALRRGVAHAVSRSAAAESPEVAWGRVCAVLACGTGLGAAACSLWALGAAGLGALSLLHAIGWLTAAALLLAGIARDGPGWRMAWPGGIAVVVLLMAPERPTFPWTARDPQDRLLRQVEDARGVLSVVGVNGGRAELDQAGQPFAPEGRQSWLARRMGRISASFAPEARQAAVLDLGSGLLVASLAAVTPANVLCVEANAARLSLLGELPFEADQSARGAAPTIVLADPGAWLVAHPRACDLIVGQPPVPDRAGDLGSSSVEHFLAMRAALREGGVAVQWFSLERYPWPAFASAARAFLTAFPDARLFVASLRADTPLVALVGGMSRGLPRREAVDALLAHAPSVAGPPASPDIMDLYVCDAWALERRFRDEPADTLAEPWVALRGERRVDDQALIARTNLRQLAGLAQPLDTTSFEARPINDRDNRLLGAELTARSAALASLLLARAAWSELRDAAPGELSSNERASLEDELSATLLAAWKAAPGHLDVRDTLLEWAGDLVKQQRLELAGALLQSAVGVAPDGGLLGLFGGVLLQLDHVAPARDLLMRARELAPRDLTVLVNLGTAQLWLGQDAAARATLSAARKVSAPAPLPPLAEVTLGLLDGDQPSVASARALLEQLPSDSPWRAALDRLLQTPPSGSPPPGAP